MFELIRVELLGWGLPLLFPISEIRSCIFCTYFFNRVNEVSSALSLSQSFVKSPFTYLENSWRSKSTSTSFLETSSILNCWSLIASLFYATYIASFSKSALGVIFKTSTEIRFISALIYTPSIADKSFLNFSSYSSRWAVLPQFAFHFLKSESVTTTPPVLPLSYSILSIKSSCQALASVLSCFWWSWCWNFWSKSITSWPTVNEEGSIDDPFWSPKELKIS